MPPDARIVHRLPGRLRLKFDRHKREAAILSMLSSELRACPVVMEVTANPVTGSVLIRHSGDEAQIIRFAATHGLFNLLPSDEGPVDVQAQMTAGLRGFSRELQGVTGGALDLNALIVVGLAGLAIQQAIEGNIMVPAASLLWYAYNASRMPPLGREPQPGEPADPAPDATDTSPGPGAPAAGGAAQQRVKKKHRASARKTH